VGTVAGDENTEELILSWDPDVLEINMFDDAFLEWKKTTGKSTPETDTSTGWSYITVKIMPYSAETIGFFRGSGFESKVVTMDALHEFIEAEKKKETE